MRFVIGLVKMMVLAALTGAVVFVLGMRAKSPVVLDAVRRTNRTLFNPRQMSTAGSPGSYASVMRHRGRSSGTEYETPVGAVATEDGFVITLPYGTRSDWVRNVLARGSAELVHEGATHQVTQPEIVSTATVSELFDPGERVAQRVFKVDECLRVRRTGAAGPTAERTADQTSTGSAASGGAAT